MNKKIAFVFDSTTILDSEKYAPYLRYETASLKVAVEGNQKRELDLEDKEIEDSLENVKNMKSASPSVDEFFTLYEKLYKEGYQHIIVVPISSGLSGTIQVAEMAKNFYDDLDVNHDDSQTEGTLPITERKENIHILDVKVCNYAISNVIDSVLPYFIESEKEGTDLDVDFVCEKILENASNSKTLFTVLNLMHLFRGGRLSKISCLIGTVLKIKPVIHINPEGKLGVFAKKRKQSDIIKMMEDVIADYSSRFKKVYLRVIDLNNHAQNEEIQQFALSNYPNVQVTTISRVGPVFLVHLGNNGFGITITGEN